jgi:hypothetical protein
VSTPASCPNAVARCLLEVKQATCTPIMRQFPMPSLASTPPLPAPQLPCCDARSLLSVGEVAHSSPVAVIGGGHWVVCGGAEGSRPSTYEAGPRRLPIEYVGEEITSCLACGTGSAEVAGQRLCEEPRQKGGVTSLQGRPARIVSSEPFLPIKLWRPSSTFQAHPYN